MSDRFVLPLLALLALGLIGLALVWPQGLGRRSPGPFGHAPTAAAASLAPKPRPPSPAPEAATSSALRGELPTADAKR